MKQHFEYFKCQIYSQTVVPYAVAYLKLVQLISPGKQNPYRRTSKKLLYFMKF